MLKLLVSCLQFTVTVDVRFLVNLAFCHCITYMYIFYSAAALLAMQSAVLATTIPSVPLSVHLSVRLLHAGTLPRRIKIGLRGLHFEAAKTL